MFAPREPGTDRFVLLAGRLQADGAGVRFCDKKPGTVSQGLRDDAMTHDLLAVAIAKPNGEFAGEGVYGSAQGVGGGMRSSGC